MTSAKRKSSARKAPRGRAVFDELLTLVTEKNNPSSGNLHNLSIPRILKIINREDAKVASAVAGELKYIARAVEMTVSALSRGGRIIYLGAGTSGRLGVLDAAECPPTFGTSPNLIKGIIAGGNKSLIRSREGVEDDLAAVAGDLARQKIGKKDVVIGITASRRTPYVLEGLRIAKSKGAGTIFITCNPRKNVPKSFDLAICPVVGPEVIAGSSRMKAGTAQKMILNMISTATMVKMGKIYGNRMVDLRATSEKLKERSKRVIMEICGIDYRQAGKVLAQSGGSVKVALIMALTDNSKANSIRLLKESGGFVHRVLGGNPKKQLK